MNDTVTIDFVKKNKIKFTNSSTDDRCMALDLLNKFKVDGK